MRRFAILGLILLAATLVVFAATDKSKDKDKNKDKKSQTQTQPQTQTEPSVSYETIKEGTSSGVRESMAKLITTDAEWTDLWKKHVSILVPQPLLPEVDFTSESIVAIFAGEKKTSGYRVLIKDVSMKEKDVVVTYKITEPPANSFTLQVVTQPFLLLKVSKPEGGTIQLVKQ
jgi:PrcB C-terminal